MAVSLVVGINLANGRLAHLEMNVKWTELYQRAAEARCDLFVMDASVGALADSRSASLHAWVTAELPTTSDLCAALDAFGVPVSDQVEAQVAMRCGLAMFGATRKNNEQTSNVQPTLGSSRPAVA
jgi:hypothetical protein